MEYFFILIGELSKIVKQLFQVNDILELDILIEKKRR